MFNSVKCQRSEKPPGGLNVPSSPDDCGPAVLRIRSNTPVKAMMLVMLVVIQGGFSQFSPCSLSDMQCIKVKRKNIPVQRVRSHWEQEKDAVRLAWSSSYRPRLVAHSFPPKYGSVFMTGSWQVYRPRFFKFLYIDGDKMKRNARKESKSEFNSHCLLDCCPLTIKWLCSTFKN